MQPTRTTKDIPSNPASRSVSPTAHSRTWFAPLLAATLASAFGLFVFYCFRVDQKHSGVWGCEMSWMTPSYHSVDWPDAPTDKYRMYLYREAGWDLEPKPNGHPVIFVPGNAGSYQQVRSIASSAARQFYSEPSQRASDMADATSLDFFTVDFNEDFSAFHGPTLLEQARFLAAVIKHVRSLYQNDPHISIIGHSMGGIVARLALQHDVATLVDAILTMSTPHAYPPIPFDRAIENIYRTLSSQRFGDDMPLLFSLCGGVSDTQIVSDSCVIGNDVLASDSGFAVFTTGVPGVWTGVDHQAMVWCHQTRWRVARVLLDMTRTQLRTGKLESATQWLLNEESLLGSAGISKVSPPSHARFCERNDQCRTVNVRHIVLPRPTDREAPFPLPGEGVRPDEVDYLLTLAEAVHGVLSYGDTQVDMQPIFSSEVRGARWGNNHSETLLKLRLVDLTESALLVHKLQLSTPACRGTPPVIRHLVSPARRLTGINFEHHVYPLSSTGSIYLHSHIHSAPFVDQSESARGTTLEIVQHAGCPVTRLTVRLDWSSSLSKIVIRYRTVSIAWTLGWTALLLAYQLGQWEVTGRMPDAAESVAFVGTVWCPRVAVGLSVVGGILSLLQLRHTEVLLLGMTSVRTLPLVPILSVWTFGLAAGVTLIIRGLTLVSSLFARSLGDTRHSTSWTSIVMSTLIPLALVLFVIPQQLGFVLLFVMQIIAAGSSRGQQSPNRYRLGLSLLCLTFLLLPFNLLPLAVWGRNLWTNWRYSFTSDHNPLFVLPLLGIVEIGGASAELRLRPLFSRSIRYTLYAAASLSFLIGPRFAFILPVLMSFGFTLIVLGILKP